MGKALQPVSVDGIEFDALIGSSESYDANVPTYSVETGFAVSDTIILNPESLDMTLFLSNRPVTWAGRFSVFDDRVERVVQQLKELYFQKKLIAVTTSSDTYTNMAITNLTISKTNAMMGALEIPIKLQKIRCTTTKTATIPASYGKSGASGASAGTASTTGSAGGAGASSGSSAGGASVPNAGKGGSILYNVAASAGLL